MVVVGVSFVFSAVRYNVIDLSHHLDSFSYSVDMNDRNQVVGYGFAPSTVDSALLRRAFVYRDGAVQELAPAKPGKECLALGINDSGVVVGCTYESGFRPEVDRIHHACMWVDSEIVDLGTLGGIRSMACDVNNRGQVAGYYSVRTQDTHRDYVYVYDQGRVTVLTIPEDWARVSCSQVLISCYHEQIELDTYPERYTRVVDVDINDNGYVMASFTSNMGDNRTVLWTDEAVIDLTEHASDAELAFWGSSLTENNAIAGREFLCGSFPAGRVRITYPAVWTGATIEQVTYYSEFASNVVAGMNSAGQIVGYVALDADTDTADSKRCAVTWEADTFAFLNDFVDSTLGWDLNIAMAINDSGFIVGCGRRAGKIRAFMLAPCSPAVVLPQNGRVTVTLTKASARLVSDVYLVQPDSLLLIADNLTNVGTTVDTVYRLGTELRFAIEVHGDDSVYRHYSDSKFAKISTVSETEWTIHFEDLPEERADWDYDDVVIHVVLSPVSSVNAVAGPHRMTSRPNVAMYDLLGRRVGAQDRDARLNGADVSRSPAGAFVIIENGTTRSARVRVRGASVR
jgi:probable HAF family extracellular repeat protein